MKKHVPIGLMPMRTLITNPQKMLPMTLQEWKAKINGYFQPKTPAERQKLMKYAVVMPGAIICGVVICWLLYSGLQPDGDKVGNVFQTDVPAGEQEQLGTKAQEYAAADAAKEKRTAEVTINTMDSIVSTSEDSVPQQSAIVESAEQYQQVQQSLSDFYVPDYSQQSEVAELQAKIDELKPPTLWRNIRLSPMKWN